MIATLAPHDVPTELHLPLTTADAVWVATATLQAASPEAQSFSTEEIVATVMKMGLTASAEKSVWSHVNQHCVANRKPMPNRSCMLFATGGGNRRVFRTGDRRDPARDGAPTHPVWENLPASYRHLQTWYQTWNTNKDGGSKDPLLQALGAGRGLWGGLTPDDYVADLRANWGDLR